MHVKYLEWRYRLLATNLFGPHISSCNGFDKWLNASQDLK